jgi:hypothetical protein
MNYPFKIVIDRTADVEGSPLISGNMPFSIITKGEHADNDQPKGRSEAYIIDTEDDWKLILDRIKSDLGESPIPTINFSKNAVLAYFFGTTGSGGNKFKIKKIDGVPNTLTIFLNIEFVVGPLDNVTSPFIIILSPKTSHKTVIIEIVTGYDLDGIENILLSF